MCGLSDGTGFCGGCNGCWNKGRCHPSDEYTFDKCSMRLCHAPTGTCQTLPGTPDCTPDPTTTPAPLVLEPTTTTPAPIVAEPTTTTTTTTFQKKPAPAPAPAPLPNVAPGCNCQNPG